MRLLEVLAGHAAVALENAGLYESARREAERATALLEFSRQLSTRRGHGRGRRPHRRALRPNARLAARVGLVPGNRRRRGSRPRRPTVTRSSTASVCSRMHFDHESAARVLRRRSEPFVRRPMRSATRSRAQGRRRAAGRSPSRRSRSTADGSAASRSPLPNDGEFSERQLRLLAGVAHQAKLALTNAGNFQSLETDLPRDGRGARERTRGERRVHVVTCALDHRSGAAGRRGARPRDAFAQAARARRAVPRHRQDRHPRGDPVEARAR